MNRKIMVFVILTALWLHATERVQAQVSAPQKRALLVAVNGYDDPKKHGTDAKKKWWSLNTTPDVEAIRDALINHFGFKASDIKILSTPEQTTHDGILKAFREFLIKPTRKGDVVYFHYSGHGSTADDSAKAHDGKPYPGNLHPDDKPNGLDQTLIPSDYAAYQDPSKDIFGDEIGQLLSELKQQKPGNVTLTFDCCFAGTNTRGGGRMLVRGMARGIPHPNPQAGQPQPGAPRQDLIEKDPRDLGYTVIAATRSDQVAGEMESMDIAGKSMGLFSYALVQALNETTGRTNYHDLFDRIAAIMGQQSHTQDPLMEGPSRVAVLGTEKVENRQTLLVDLRDGRPIVRAGRLNGMNAGTTLKIYAPNADLTKDMPLTEATVDHVDSIFSTLTLAKPDLKPNLLLAAKAVILKRAYPDNPLRIDVSAIAMHPRRKEIQAILETMQNENKTIKITQSDKDPCDIRLALPEKTRGEAAPTNALRLLTPDGSPLQCNVGTPMNPTYVTALPDSDRLPRQIEDTIECESRWRMVTALRNDDKDNSLKVAVRLIPVAVKRDASGKILRNKYGNPFYDHDLPSKQVDGKSISFQIGEFFVIEVENIGLKEAHITLLDLSPDGSMQALWPKRGLLDAENHLKVGEKKRICLVDPKVPFPYEPSEPLGKELIKAIITEEKSDFSALVDDNEATRSRGAVTEDGKSPLGQFLRSTKERHTRGVKGPVGIIPANWATTDVYFYVGTPPPAK